MQILHTVQFFISSGAYQENLFDKSKLLKLVIISFILLTRTIDFKVIQKGEIRKWTGLHVIWSWLYRPKLEHFAIEFYLIFLSLHCFSNRMAMYQPVKWCLKCATVTTLLMEKTSQDGHPFTYQLQQDSTMSLLNWLLSHLQILKPWIMMAGNKSQSDNTCRW